MSFSTFYLVMVFGLKWSYQPLAVSCWLVLSAASIAMRWRWKSSATAPPAHHLFPGDGWEVGWFGLWLRQPSPLADISIDTIWTAHGTRIACKIQFCFLLLPYFLFLKIEKLVLCWWYESYHVIHVAILLGGRLGLKKGLYYVSSLHFSRSTTSRRVLGHNLSFMACLAWRN